MANLLHNGLPHIRCHLASWQRPNRDGRRLARIACARCPPFAVPAPAGSCPKPHRHLPRQVRIEDNAVGAT